VFHVEDVELSEIALEEAGQLTLDLWRGVPWEGRSARVLTRAHLEFSLGAHTRGGADPEWTTAAEDVAPQLLLQLGFSFGTGG